MCACVCVCVCVCVSVSARKVPGRFVDIYNFTFNKTTSPKPGGYPCLVKVSSLMNNIRQ